MRNLQESEIYFTSCFQLLEKSGTISKLIGWASLYESVGACLRRHQVPGATQIIGVLVLVGEIAASANI